MNEPAFPVTPTDKSGQIAPTYYGMTLRDYFAAKAMLCQWGPRGTAMDVDMCAKLAYQYADALLAERAKHE